jgi:uncharacterized protein
VTLALAALAVAAGAGAQSVSGIGFALVGGPLLFSVFGAREGVRVAVARAHRAVMWRRMSPVLVTALVVTPVLAHVLSDAHPRALRALAGAVIVLGAGLVAAGRTADTGLAGGVVAGLVSATMNVLASAGGPAVAVYASGARWDARGVRPTLQAYFLALNVVTVATLGAPHWSLTQAVVLIGCLLVGSAAGAWAAGRVNPEKARAVTLALAAAGGLGVLISAV